MKSYNQRKGKGHTITRAFNASQELDLHLDGVGFAKIAITFMTYYILLVKLVSFQHVSDFIPSSGFVGF